MQQSQLRLGGVKKNHPGASPETKVLFFGLVIKYSQYCILENKSKNIFKAKMK